MVPYALKTTVDISKCSKEIVWESLANVGDRNAHKIIVTIVDKGIPVDLSSCTATLQVMRGDGATRFLSASIDGGGSVSATLDASCYEVVGELICTMVITAADVILSAARIFLEVTEKHGAAVVDPSRVVPTLAELLAEMNAMREGTQAANAAAKRAEDGENERETAESKRVLAEDARQKAETNRATAETSRAQAEKARVTAEETRAANEKSRVTAETEREKQMTANTEIVDRYTDFAVEVEALPPSSDPYADVEQTAKKTLLKLGIPTSNFAYATFWIDFETRQLMMRVPNGFSAISFAIQNRELVVRING